MENLGVNSTLLTAQLINFVLMFSVLALMITVVYVFVRRNNQREKLKRQSGNEAQSLLKQRLAEGKINEDEYQYISEVMEGAPQQKVKNG